MYPKYFFKDFSTQTTLISGSLTDSQPQSKELTWLCIRNSVGKNIKMQKAEDVILPLIAHSPIRGDHTYIPSRNELWHLHSVWTTGN